MTNFKNKPIRKMVYKGESSTNLYNYETVIISDEVYSTKGELLLIVRDVSNCKVKLDSTTTDRIKIKTLTNCIIIPDIGRIDDDWDEIFVSRGACVELQNVNGIWYILSSDGIKME